MRNLRHRRAGDLCKLQDTMSFPILTFSTGTTSNTDRCRHGALVLGLWCVMFLETHLGVSLWFPLPCTVPSCLNGCHIELQRAKINTNSSREQKVEVLSQKWKAENLPEDFSPHYPEHYFSGRICLWSHALFVGKRHLRSLDKVASASALSYMVENIHKENMLLYPGSI